MLFYFRKVLEIKNLLKFIKNIFEQWLNRYKKLIKKFKTIETHEHINTFVYQN